MKIAVVFVLLSAPVIFRSAWLISRACRPTWLSPISPSISARGTSAATESMTMTSIAPDRISMSAISSACSPVSGWETSSASVSTPSALRVLRIERVLGVDERGDAAGCLRVRHRVQRDRGLTAGLRTVDLDDPATRAGRRCRARRRARWSRSGSPPIGIDRAFAEPHHRALAELLVDLREREVERLLAVWHCLPWLPPLLSPVFFPSELFTRDTLGVGPTETQPPGRDLWMSAALWTIAEHVYDASSDTPIERYRRHSIGICGAYRAPNGHHRHTGQKCLVDRTAIQFGQDLIRRDAGRVRGAEHRFQPRPEFG